MDNKKTGMLFEEMRLSKKRTAKLEKIDGAAVELFSQKGYANTSSKDIAELAQVAEGTIFRHYGTKENLLVHTLVRFLNVLIPICKTGFINDITHKKFETMEDFAYFLIKNRLSFIRKNRSMFKVLVKEIVYDDTLRQSLMSKYSGEAKSVLYAAFDSVKDRGRLEGVPNEVLMERLLKTTVPEFVWMFVLTDGYETVDEEEWIKDTVHRFIKGI